MRKSDGNPEGKGVNGLLLDYYNSEPRGVVAKPGRRILAEYFTSLLVLSANCRYRPVPGAPNYLYFIDGEWSLSLIAPVEWTDERRAGFAGTCVLQRDMTWTIAPSDSLRQQSPIADAVSRFFDAFAEMLDTDLTLEELLPTYVETMPYYQRLYANALSRSLRATVSLGDQVAINGKRWRALLPPVENLLPACSHA